MTLAVDHQAGWVDATADALERISVSAPYFDLSDLVVDDGGTVRALVPLRPPTQPEEGLIAATEVARHLAILGSCALALQHVDGDRHHYLATKAHFLRTANFTTADASGDVDDRVPPGHLVAEASGAWADRRSARALAKLYGPHGRLSHVLDVHYTVMAPRIFKRVMPAIDQKAVRGDAAGVGRSDVLAGGREERFDVSVADGRRVAVDCGPVPLDMCAGHFPDYPAAPVALVMGRLARAAGVAMNRHLGFGELSYTIDEARVVATRLARVGQRLTLDARYERPVGGGHLLVGSARADGEVVGDMVLTLSVPNPSV